MHNEHKSLAITNQAIHDNRGMYTSNKSLKYIILLSIYIEYRKKSSFENVEVSPSGKIHMDTTMSLRKLNPKAALLEK